MMSNYINILRDTREKNGWDFELYDDVIVTDTKLEYGDYTTDILQGYVCIERKASVIEIANNFGKKDKFERIKREFEYMCNENVPYKYLICEFGESEIFKWPHVDGVSKKVKARLRLNGKFLYKTLLTFANNFGVELVFCPTGRDEAENYVYQLFQQFTNRLQ